MKKLNTLSDSEILYGLAEEYETHLRKGEAIVADLRSYAKLLDLADDPETDFAQRQHILRTVRDSINASYIPSSKNTLLMEMDERVVCSSGVRDDVRAVLNKYLRGR